MATRTYTKPADPINVVDLAAKITTDTGKSVTCSNDAGNLYVTGTITSGDDTAIQNSINAYVYTVHPGDAGWLSVDDGSMSTASRSKASSQRASYDADTTVLAVANSKTAVRFWDNGAFLNGSPTTGDMIVFSDSQTVAGGSGVATFNITSDHTSSGSALCSTIYLNSIKPATVDDTANFNPGQPSVASNKVLSVPYTKQGSSGATILGIGVLTTITYPAAPNSTVVTVVGWGLSV